MSEISDRYRRRAAAFTEKVAAVPDDRWDAPTPCDDWTVRELVGHVVGTQGLFLGFVGQEVGEAPSVDDDPLGAWQAATAAVQAELDDPERAGAEFDGLGGRTTLEAAVDRILALDLVLHGWDLARGAGLDDTIQPGEIEHVFENARALEAAFGEHARSPAVFGPALDTPADASDEERLLAFTGRRA